MGALGTARNIPLGLPFQGMDLQTPLANLPMSRAPFIENFFIDGQTLKVRLGVAKYSQMSAATSSDLIYTLGTYSAQSGTQKLYAVKNNAGTSRIFDFSADPASNIAATSLQSNALFLQYRTYFYAFDGANVPKAYDGTDWADFGAAFATSGLTAGFTGPASVNNFIGGVAYKNRLYLVENNSARVWYGGVDSISGAMTSLDVASLLQFGGKLHYAATINYGQNSTAAAYLCLISDQGEVLAYQGSYPGSPSFELVAKFQIGKPLSRRGYLNYQGDTLVATDIGLVSLRDMISYALQGNGQTYKTYSAPVDPYWKDVVQSLRNAGYTDTNNVVSIAFFKRTGCIYVLFAYSPTRTDNQIDPDATQGCVCFVYNTLTNAWFSYRYRLPDVEGSVVLTSLVEYGTKLIMGGLLNGIVWEIEKPKTFRDEHLVLVGQYETITANLLSAALSSNRDSGVRQKFNSLELFAYINAGSATDPLECYLVENFGKTTGTTKPAIIEDDFNSIPLNVGSSREYVQYSLTVKTNSSSGDPTVLYNLNALMEQGGYR